MESLLINSLMLNVVLFVISGLLFIGFINQKKDFDLARIRWGKELKHNTDCYLKLLETLKTEKHDSDACDQCTQDGEEKCSVNNLGRGLIKPEIVYDSTHCRRGMSPELDLCVSCPYLDFCDTHVVPSRESVIKSKTCHPSHELRHSDSSFYDNVCIKCGERDIAGDGWGNLVNPCKPITHGKIKVGGTTLHIS